MCEIPEYRRPVKTVNTLPSKTEKAHQSRVNINTIAAKILRGHQPPTKAGGVYGDFTSIEDYHSCLNKVNDAVNDFNRLPSEVRKAFDNSPGSLIEFLSDESNRDAAIELGLIERPPPEPPEAPPVEDPPSPE